MNRNWCEKVRRVAKLFMVEPDPEQYDYEFWVDYFEKTHVNVVSASAGGIVAFYPTDVPYHRRSPWLGSGDGFGDLVRAARDRGAFAMARVDPHATHDEAKQAHPEWIAVDAAGNPRRHWSNPEMWVTCVLGPYYDEFMTEVVREIETRYRVEGFHVNRWMGSGVCYCEHCLRSFHEFSGMEIPRKVRSEDPFNPAWALYDRWFGARLLQIWDSLEAAVQEINPDAHFLPNLYVSPIISSADLRARVQMINVDYQARSVRDPLWAIGRAGRKVRAAMGSVPVVAGISPGFEGSGYRWKDSVRDSSDLKMWYVDAIANNMWLAWGKFSATLYDHRWLEPVREIFDWHHSNERYLENTESNTEIALAWSPPAVRATDGKPVLETEDAQQGAYRALLEARVPFDLVKTDLFGDGALAGYRVLVLPDMGRLSDEACEAIRRFVESGGSVVASGETSLYDEDGTQRADFALADLFGASFRGRRPAPVKNSYLRLEQRSDGSHHPLLRGLEDAGRIIHGTLQLELSLASPPEETPLTLIPSYPDLPMEDVYPREPKTDIPEVVLRNRGEARVAFFPWDIDRVLWEIDCKDHSVLLANAVFWALDKKPDVHAAGPGLVEITSWLQTGSMTVHLVNLSHPSGRRGSLHELIPVGAQQITVNLPPGKKLAGVRLLVSTKRPLVAQVGETVTVTVPELLAHEVVALDLA